MWAEFDRNMSNLEKKHVMENKYSNILRQGLEEGVEELFLLHLKLT